ncbi:MAG: hypothetical protein H0U55_17750, partial [Rubrobacteraceae bacterium]|nr:hypothetical protein [Rubrobacteraceae bacterium]
AWAATIQCPEKEGRKCEGTSGPDTMYGTGEDYVYGDWIDGHEGSDKIYGFGGDDKDNGGHGTGGLFGGRGDDLVRGGDGQDEISGGKGSDRLYGGRGGDSITGEGTFVNHTPRDLIVGGPGDDRLAARDGQKDRIYCGTGFDSVDADDASKSWPDDSGDRDLVDDSCEEVHRY